MPSAAEPETIDTPIALEARDLLPETWAALAQARSFGPAALERWHTRTLLKIFGSQLSDDDIDALNPLVTWYAGKYLAFLLLDPAIDYWSKQVLSRTAGERESAAWKDRVEDLKELRKEWAGELAEMRNDVLPLLPLVPTGRASDAPRVAQAGGIPGTDEDPRDADQVQVVHATVYPYDIPPAYGPPETTTTTSAAG